MLAHNNTDIQEAIATVYQLTQEEKIRQQCEAREDYYRRQNDVQRWIKKQDDTIEQQNQLIEQQAETITQLHKKIGQQNDTIAQQDKKIDMLADEISELRNLITQLQQR